MRRLTLPFLTFVVGLGIGALAIVLLPRPTVDAAIPDEAAILRIERPELNSVDAEDVVGLDDVWQRVINDAVFLIKHESDGVICEPDIENSEWFGEFNDHDGRTDALRANLHVEQIPGTSMIVIRFDTSSSADARTITNMAMSPDTRPAKGPRTQALCGPGIEPGNSHRSGRVSITPSANKDGATEPHRLAMENKPPQPGRRAPHRRSNRTG